MKGRSALREAAARAAILAAAAGALAVLRLAEMEHPVNARTALLVFLLAGSGGAAAFLLSLLAHLVRIGPILRGIAGALLAAPAVIGLFGLAFFVHLRLVRGQIDADFELEGVRHLLFRLAHDTAGIAVATGGVYLAPWLLAGLALAGSLALAWPFRRAL